MQKFLSVIPRFRRSGAMVRVLVAGTALFLVCSCSKTPVPPVPTPEPTPVPTPVPTPKPTPVPTPTPPPTPTPVVHHYAPEGTYFVTEDITVRLKAGLAGIVAGTPVKMLKDNGDTLHVTDTTNEFDVKKSQVTNDIDIAAAIARRAAAAGAAADAATAAQEAILQKQQSEQIEFLRTHPLGGPAPSVTPH